MQDNNRYLNLLRTAELAKRKGEPYVPFDGYELELFTAFAALEHLPALDSNEQHPEGWKLQKKVPVTDFQKLTDETKVWAKDFTSPTFGLVVSSDRKDFLVFARQ
jgi:hypothetical protein